MIGQSLPIPLLHGQVPQRRIIHGADPAPSTGHQNPISRSCIIDDPLLTTQTELTQAAEWLIRLKHAIAASRCTFNPEIPQHLLKHQHLRLAAGRAEPEPAEHYQPERTDASGLGKKEPDPHQDREQRQGSARGRGHLNPTPLAARDLPDECLENQASIQRKARKQIEQSQHDVHHREFGHQTTENRAEVRCSMNAEQQTAPEDKAHQWACSGDPECTHRRGALPLHTGDTAKKKQCDAAHFHALPQGDQRMTQLMEQHRDEQEERREQTENPGTPDPESLHRRNSRPVGLGYHSDQGHDQKPTGMHPEGNTPDAHQLPAFTHGSPPPGLKWAHLSQS